MSVGRVGAAAPEQQKTKEYSSTLDQDAFLNLLVTQLRNQDPLEPMDNTEFISQMAEFSALEQAQNTNKTTKQDTAYNMVNKIATASYYEEEENKNVDITGIVSSVKVDDNKIMLVINGKDINFDDVTEVADLVSEYEQIQTINHNFKTVTAFSLIGKDVKAKVDTDKTGKNSEEVSGIVNGIRMENGSIYAQIGEREIPIDTIYQVN